MLAKEHAMTRNRASDGAQQNKADKDSARDVSKPRRVILRRFLLLFCKIRCQ
jgi:hypothetical protein